MTKMEMIKEFHKKFGLEYNDGPRRLPAELEKFRFRFMEEELFEYESSVVLVDQLDALVDLVYVAMGTAYLHGFNFDEAFKRVHEANMKKKRSVGTLLSGRGSVWDVVKPDDWEPPFLDDLVRNPNDIE